jgi:hypothetical protein
VCACAIYYSADTAGFASSLAIPRQRRIFNLFVMRLTTRIPFGRQWLRRFSFSG